MRSRLRPRLRPRLGRPAAAAIATLLALPAVAAGPAAPTRFAAAYALSFMSLPIGTAGLRAERRGDRYVLTVDAGLKGLAGFFLDGSGSAVSRGRLAAAGTVPDQFRLDSRYSGVPIRVLMRLSGGRVRESKVEPVPPPRPDRVPVTPADMAGVTDPVGMLAVPTGGKPLAPAMCDRRIPVFDGGTRVDVVLSRGSLADVTEGPYRGPALDCRIRWVPVSGHRPDRPAVRSMAANDEMRVRLAPVPGGGLLLPLTIAVATGWGEARVEATAWGEGAEAKAVDGARP